MFSLPVLLFFDVLRGPFFRKKKKFVLICVWLCVCFCMSKVHENRGRMTRRKSICVVKICTPREVHGGVMGGHAVNVLPPMDILCGVLQEGSAGVVNEPRI